MEVTALTSSPGESGELGETGLVSESLDVPDLRQEACSEHGPDTGNGQEGSTQTAHLVFDVARDGLDLLFEVTDVSQGGSQDAVDRIPKFLGQAVSMSRRFLDCPGGADGIHDAVIALFCDESGS